MLFSEPFSILKIAAMIYCYLILLHCMWFKIIATSGEEGRKSLMREIELGKLLGEKPQPNIVKFIGCVTTQGKKFAIILLGK